MSTKNAVFNIALFLVYFLYYVWFFEEL